MQYQRVWDSSCPKIWDQWQSDDGRNWIIQDLPPEEDQLAVDAMLMEFCPDETLCSSMNLLDDNKSVEEVRQLWTNCLKQRMSLACYEVKGGNKMLAALNVCYVEEKGKKIKHEFHGKVWKAVYDCMDYVSREYDIFEEMNTDKALYAMGLLVRRHYRSNRIGGRVLAARKPLALSQGVTVASTVFTSVAAQKLAARCGYTTAREVTLHELADAGFPLPKDDRIVKLMATRFD